jgi:streptomycin 6-kinase
LNGSSVIKLLEEDRGRQAILLERAVPGEALFQRFKDDPLASVGPAIRLLRSISCPPSADRTDVDTLDKWYDNFRRYRETEFPAERAAKAFEIYERLSVQPGRTFYLHGDFHPGNIVTAIREPYLVIDPKGIVGHLGYDMAVFLNNLHWWRRDDASVPDLLAEAIGRFASAFEFTGTELREWAFACMVIGAWWNFEDMPEHYDANIAMSNIWGV